MQIKDKKSFVIIFGPTIPFLSNLLLKKNKTARKCPKRKTVIPHQAAPHLVARERLLAAQVRRKTAAPPNRRHQHRSTVGSMDPRRLRILGDLAQAGINFHFLKSEVGCV